MKKGKVIKWIILLILLAAAVTCGIIFIPKLFSKKESRAEMGQRINTVALSKMDLTESISATGTIESAKKMTVSADIQNVRVQKVLVEVGDTVKKGQKLLSFDRSSLKDALTEAKEDYSDTLSQTSTELSQAYQQLSDARSSYASDKKRLEQVVKEAEAALKKARKAAKKSRTASEAKKGDQPGDSDFKPGTGDGTGVEDGTKPGGGNGTGGTGNGGTGSSGNGETGGTGAGVGNGESSVTISDNMTVTEAKVALKQAKENLASANKQNLKQITSAQQAIRQAQTNNKKQIRQAKRSVQDARETLKSAAIKATMDGTVTALGISAGDSYNGGDAVEISDLSSFQVKTTVTEYDINKVEKGQRVVILTDATGDEEIEGTITYVALTTGSTSLSGGSSSSGAGGSGGMSMGGSSSSSSGYEVVITLTGSHEKIRSGMTAKCSIICKEAKDVYAVPYDAIHTNKNNEDVIYAMDSSGNRKEITVTKGMESDYYVEVTSSELSDGLSVIIPSDASTATESGDSDSGGDGFGFMMGSGGPPSGSFPGGGSGGMPSGGFPGGN